MGQVVSWSQFGQNMEIVRTKIHKNLGVLKLMAQAIGHAVQVATWARTMMAMNSMLP
jgi:hypothetical protein